MDRPGLARFFWICLGGAVGTGARYLLALWAAAAFGLAFPFGTLLVNLLGSFLIAAILEVATTTSLIPDTLRLGLTTGILGGFTTYSSFSYETLRFLQQGAWKTSALYVLVTVCGCLAAAMLGWAAARWAFV